MVLEVPSYRFYNFIRQN